MGAITVYIMLDRLQVASLSALSPSRPPNKVAITQLDPNANIRAAIKAFVRDHLYIAEDIQRLTAPLFSKVSDGECIEDVYSRYACHVDLDVTNLHLDEDTFCVYGLEGSQTVTLSDSDSLHDRHILDKSTLYLHALPRSLPPQGGRIYVETKEGVLPLTGIRPTTTVRAVKELLSKLTLIPICRQMLYSIGRVMHDEMMVRDFEGLHAVHVDSVLDMCVSGDSSREQTHKRIVVKVQSDQSFGGCIESSATTSTSGSCTSSSPFSSSSSFAAAEPLLVVCQGRDTVRELMAVIETRAGIPMSGKRLRFGGKLLDKDKSLADYFVQQECMLHIVPSGSPFKPTRLALPEPIYADDSPVGKVVAASRRAGESGGVGGEGSAGGRARSPAAAGGIYGAGRERDEEAEDGEEAFVIKKTPPAARKIKMMRTSNGKIVGSIVIPVLTSDRVGDVKRKIRRRLKPLTERMFNSDGVANLYERLGDVAADVARGKSFSSVASSPLDSSIGFGGHSTAKPSSNGEAPAICARALRAAWGSSGGAGLPPRPAHLSPRAGPGACGLSSPRSLGLPARVSPKSSPRSSPRVSPRTSPRSSPGSSPATSPRRTRMADKTSAPRGHPAASTGAVTAGREPWRVGAAGGGGAGGRSPSAAGLNSPTLPLELSKLKVATGGATSVNRSPSGRSEQGGDNFRAAAVASWWKHNVQNLREQVKRMGDRL